MAELVVSVAVANTAGLSAQAQGAINVADGAGLSVRLDFADRAALTFSQAEATNLGDYIGPFVRQRCLRHRRGVWAVDFRPDVAGSSRAEIVVTLGCWPLPTGITATHITQPYKATITRGSATLATVQVPKHWWFATWRWQSTPRPIVRSLNDLVAMRALLPMGAQSLYNDPRTLTRVETYAPMGTAGLTAYMPTTGERPDIGPITDCQGCYLLRGNGEAAATLRVQAEAAGSWPVWVRDTTTERPFDVQRNPYWTFYYSAPPMQKIPQPPDPSDRELVKMDSAHLPAASFVPWLLTDDPFHLEAAQHAANYSMLESNYFNGGYKLPGLASCGQTRSWAWGMRDVARLAAFAPENPASWLLPRSYWRQCVADNLTFARQYETSTSRACRVFRAMPVTAAVASWQQGFRDWTLGWMKWSGMFPEWDSFITWAAGYALRMNDAPGTGWDRRWPSNYYVHLTNYRNIAANPSLPTADEPMFNIGPYESSTPESWAECWALYQQWQANSKKPMNANKWTADKVYQNGIDYPNGSNSPTPESPFYTEVMRCSLAAYALAGIPGARERHDWLHTRMVAVEQSWNARSTFKYAVRPV